MNLEKVFKNLIIILLVLIVLATISAFYISDAVSDFNENTPFGIFDRMGEFGLLLDLLIEVIISVFYFISLFLLYRFKPFGKKLFVYVFIISTIIDFFTGALATNAFVFNLFLLIAALDGAIIAFLYFTPIKEKFD
jgi:hypothetical protein